MSTLARFTLDEYEQIVKTGALNGRRMELIHGEMRDMSPIDPLHAELVDLLARWSIRVVPPEVRVRIQNPIGIAALDSEPEPDIAWMRERSYAKKHPTPQDVLLVIEVANSSLDFDLGEKADLYARAGIKDYWVVNVVDKWIEVCRQPKRGKYTSRERFGLGDAVKALAFPEIEIEVNRLFAD